jgi:hypothetical protein
MNMFSSIVYATAQSARCISGGAIHVLSKIYLIAVGRGAGTHLGAYVVVKLPRRQALEFPVGAAQIRILARVGDGAHARSLPPSEVLEREGDNLVPTRVVCWQRCGSGTGEEEPIALPLTHHAA